MPKRTSPNDLQHWEDASDLDHLVVDKRSHKRATPAKGRRRNRRYEKRLLNHYLENSDDLELDLETPETAPSVQGEGVQMGDRPNDAVKGYPDGESWERFTGGTGCDCGFIV